MSRNAAAPEVEQTPRGWVAWASGLAGRGSTREEAVTRYWSVRDLVTRIAGQWAARRQARAEREAE